MAARGARANEQTRAARLSRGGRAHGSDGPEPRRQFVLGMRDLGYIEGRDYLLEERYAAGQMDNFTAYAQELVELPST